MIASMIRFLGGRGESKTMIVLLFSSVSVRSWIFVFMYMHVYNLDSENAIGRYRSSLPCSETAFQLIGPNHENTFLYNSQFPRPQTPLKFNQLRFEKQGQHQNLRTDMRDSHVRVGLLSFYIKPNKANSKVDRVIEVRRSSDTMKIE